MRTAITLFFLISLLCSSLSAATLTLKRTICIWDIGGRNGPVFNAAMEQRALAVEYGINLDMVPYTNETVMVEEFKAGRCDAALMSGLRARQFNLYSGSVDAIGACLTTSICKPCCRCSLIRNKPAIWCKVTTW